MRKSGDSVRTSSFGTIIDIFTNNRPLRDVQKRALDAGLLDSRKNLIVSAPTNSGKSLVGWLGLLQAVQKGQRAILIVPLRALAQQAADELQLIAPQIGTQLNSKFTITLSTGDYRLNSETFFATAPDSELIIATPERLEAIIRSPESGEWLKSIGAVCIDEAHLISSAHRGPTLEHLITTLLTLSIPPRLILLSATLGNVEKAQEWLAPCEVVHETKRFPPLHKQVISLTDDQEIDTELSKWLQQNLSGQAQALIFVYQTGTTEKLSQYISSTIGKQAGGAGAMAYHSKMTLAQKEFVRRSFLDGHCKVVVTTSALALGLNLPATHVAVRDLTYPGATNPSVSDLLQIMGRAGRGDQEGFAVVFKRPTDNWITSDLQHALDNEILPELVSAFVKDQKASNNDESKAATSIASLLSRNGDAGMSQVEIETFFQRSLGGQQLCTQVPTALRWLNYHTLAYDEEGQYHLTVLGQKATRSVLLLSLAAGFSQLIRDFLKRDPTDSFLKQWQPLDHLLIINLLYDRTPSLRKYSSQLMGQVESWCEKPGNKAPIVFSEWISGEKGFSNAVELLGSLGISIPKKGKAGDEWARQKGYLATFNAIVLFERGIGKTALDLTRQFKVKNLEGIEERYRDDFLWLLAGVAELLDIRTFFYHLKEDCSASPERIQNVKSILRGMKNQVYDLMEHLKYCSALGPLLRTIKRSHKTGVGIQSIRKLEEAGFNLATLQDLSLDDFTKVGIRRNVAKTIHSHLKKRFL